MPNIADTDAQEIPWCPGYRNFVLAGLACCWIHRRHADSGFGTTMAPGEMPK